MLNVSYQVYYQEKPLQKLSTVYLLLKIPFTTLKSTALHIVALSIKSDLALARAAQKENLNFLELLPRISHYSPRT